MIILLLFASAFIFVGFTLQVIYATTKPEEADSPQHNSKLRKVGLISMLTGVVIILIAIFSMNGDLRTYISNTGKDIVLLGLACFIQSNIKGKDLKLASKFAWASVCVGFVLFLIYILLFNITAK